MADKSRRTKKGFISEEDASVLLQRYDLSTVLALLREVAQVAGEKIDWNELVKNSATGISGAREYRMLWRHLGYGETLTAQFDDDAKPMDDDSDLEYELEPFPAVGREASMEASACVKVLMASGCQNDTQLIAAPLTINIPRNKALVAPSDGSILANSTQGENISFPVFVQKQPLPSGTCGEKRPNNGASGVDMPSKKKRKAWSIEDDMKLTAAVQKYGDENWDNIAKGDFKNERRSSDLSQRWSHLKKKQGNANAGSSSQHSETQLAATRRAMSVALNMAMRDNLKPSGQIGTDHHLGRAGPSKSQMPTIRPSTNSISTPDSMVKAAAVAAGARIATSADASSLIEAARYQNVVRITTGGSPVIKSSPSGVSSQLPSNVHFIRNGLAKAPLSTYTAAKPNITRPVEAQSRIIKPSTSAAQPGPSSTPPVTNMPSGIENATASIPPAAALPKVAEEPVASTSANDTKDQGGDQDQAVLGNQPDNSMKENTEVCSGQTGQNQGNQKAMPNSRLEDTGEKITDNQLAAKEIPQDLSSGGGHEHVNMEG